MREEKFPILLTLAQIERLQDVLDEYPCDTEEQEDELDAIFDELEQGRQVLDTTTGEAE